MLIEELNDVCAPRPTRASKVVISSFAEALAKRLEFNVGDSIESLVARLGGKLSFQPPKHTTSRLPESIFVRSKNEFTIFLPTMTSHERDRFTVAHELGHLFLHYPEVKKDNKCRAMLATRWVDETDADLVRAEWEANWFAAAFLMPSDIFRKMWIEQGKNTVVSKFKVSTIAAATRAKSLGLK